jgi:hypothetical protein
MLEIRRREFVALLGGAAAWPLAAHAEQQTKPTIGWLDNRPGLPAPDVIEPFRRGLAENGFLEGRDVTIEYRTAEGHTEQLPALATAMGQNQSPFRLENRGPVQQNRVSRQKLASLAKQATILGFGDAVAFASGALQSLPVPDPDLSTHGRYQPALLESV